MFGKFCRRGGEHIFYAVGGLVCNSISESGRCDIENQVYAVKMGGNGTVDSRNIVYLKEEDQAQPWVWHRPVDGEGNYKLIGIPEQDKLLYNPVKSGNRRDASISNRAKCSYLFFQTTGDGFYEISIKGGETWYPPEKPGHRTFSFILNDIYIVREYHQQRQRFSPNGIELIANFQLHRNGQMLKLQGHPSKLVELIDNKLKFEVCYSACPRPKVDPNWIVAAVSIVKFKN